MARKRRAKSRPSRGAQRFKSGHQFGPRIQPSRRCAPRPRPFWLFSTLPVELCARIYSLLLRVDGAINVTCSGSPKRPAINLSLLCVSKQVAAEAADYFYSANTFLLLDFSKRGGDSIVEWLLGRKTHAHLIRNIAVYMHSGRTDFASHYAVSLRAIATLTPNVTRLALVSDTYETHLLPKDSVVRIRSATWATLGESLTGFRSLQLVQVGGRNRVALERLYGVLPPGCRVQGIRAKYIHQHEFARCGTVWDKIKKRKVWYLGRVPRLQDIQDRGGSEVGDERDELKNDATGK